MFNFWPKSDKAKSVDGSITWDAQAQQALDQATAQAPVPPMMKAMVKKQLKEAAEAHTQKAGRTTVTAEDLMQGLMAKLPDNMKSKVQEAMKKGPAGLKDLEKELKK